MLPAEPLTTREARAALTEILGDALPPLRQLRLGRRLEEMAVFGGLWGVGLALAGVERALDGTAMWAARGAAVLATALALNAFVLLLHEGMHGVLFRSAARTAGSRSGWARRSACRSRRTACSTPTTTTTWAPTTTRTTTPPTPTGLSSSG